MFKRPLFWLGLLLGSLASFRSLVRPCAGPRVQPAPTLLELVDDPLIVCDGSGLIVQANAGASALFGPEHAGLSRLCYSTGQIIPPGQLPWNRALKSRRMVTEAGCRAAAPDGSDRILNVTARPLPDGGAAAVFRDITAQQEGRWREEHAQKQQQVVTQLCRRLTQTANTEDTARVIVESISLLLERQPPVQVRLYSYNPSAQTLTRLASDPEDRPKRPRTAAASLPPIFPFDAQISAHWQLYIARQAVVKSEPVLGESPSEFSLALPLVSSGTAIGHLSIASDGVILDDPALRDTLETAAGIAALALAGPLATEMKRDFTARTTALCEIAQAVAGGMEKTRLADLVTGSIRRLTGCALCMWSVEVGAKLALSGEAYRDDLIFPERYGPNDPTLQSKATQKAWRTQKTVSQAGIVNPSYENGPWRAFAGTSGRHCILAMPVPRRMGVLTVCSHGAVPLPEMQIMFLGTVAALLGSSAPEVPSTP